MIDLSSGTIHSIKTLADKCLRVTIDCREMSALDMTILMSAYMEGHEGVQIPEISSTEEDGGKSPAQRLRAVLFKIYETNTSRSETFEEFYRKYMERLLASLKEKIA